MQNNELLGGQTIARILDETISPRLFKRGLIWNGKDLWFDQPQNTIRQVFKYLNLKGGTGTFAWGVCLDFVPTISSNKLRPHRTDKSVVQHLFEWTEEYSNSFFGGQLDGGITTHCGRRKSELSIKSLLNKYEPIINAWFERSTTIENLISIAELQIRNGKSYAFHDPNQRLVLAFLQAYAKQLDNAIKNIHLLAIDDSLKELLLRKISKVA